MADADFDVGQLSAPQQEALQQYVGVTNQEIKDALPLLERSQLNVQVRVYFVLSRSWTILMLPDADCHSQVLRR
jgi:hypothetical protein